MEVSIDIAETAVNAGDFETFLVSLKDLDLRKLTSTDFSKINKLCTSMVKKMSVEEELHLKSTINLLKNCSRVLSGKIKTKQQQLYLYPDWNNVEQQKATLHSLEVTYQDILDNISSLMVRLKEITLEDLDESKIDESLGGSEASEDFSGLDPSDLEELGIN